MTRLGSDWPTGNYSGKCATCGIGFGGDKRDPLCVQCAIAAHVAAAVAAERARILTICDEESADVDSTLYRAAANRIGDRIRMEAP